MWANSPFIQHHLFKVNKAKEMQLGFFDQLQWVPLRTTLGNTHLKITEQLMIRPLGSSFSSNSALQLSVSIKGVTSVCGLFFHMYYRWMSYLCFTECSPSANDADYAIRSFSIIQAGETMSSLICVEDPFSQPVLTHSPFL